jgi:hypothetical protein
MKKHSLLFTCLLHASFSFSQNYLPMAVENAHWIMYAISEDGPDHNVVSVKGDTVINGILYKKTWRQHIVSDATAAIDFHPPFQVETPVLIGAMRDETATQQVHYVSFQPFYTENDTCDLFDDWLIYDFSMAVNDTIGGCLQYTASFPLTVTNLTTESLWGEDRRVIEAGGSARLVEGIGTDMGPFWRIFAWPHPAKPSFLYDYCALEDTSCGLQPVSSAHQRLADWQIELSPNPATEQLTVNLPEGQPSTFPLRVFDFSGKMVLEKSVQSAQASVQVSIANLPSGVYFLTLQWLHTVATCRFAKL